MKTIRVHHYDAFSAEPNRGNPAGLVLDDGEERTEEDMQRIAEAVGFNETSFVMPSASADVRIRYFTPGHEMNLCGHATVATIFALKTRGLLGDKKALTIETKAGVLPIRIEEAPGGGLAVTMRQAPPEFRPFEGSVEALAASIGIAAADIDPSLPIVYGSTGIWTLLVPVVGLGACRRMRPNNQAFPEILREMPRASVHPFCLETNDPAADMHARHFSSPFSGTIEDPVTGTASGVMGAYYARYVANTDSAAIVVEQGHEIGRDGRVRVAATGDVVFMTGTAVYVKSFDVSI
ncbi:PhzF family phenazine biosynthesis isomerase [Paenibacillus sp. TRM 82003]|nr:PhzF family phenazine biosynthesis isomerase [Paenibacillus sp. TRM 82003]